MNFAPSHSELERSDADVGRDEMFSHTQLRLIGKCPAGHAHLFLEKISNISEDQRLHVSSVGQSSHLPFTKTAIALSASSSFKKPPAANPSLRKIVVPAVISGALSQSCRALNACHPGTSNNLSPFNWTFGRLGERPISTKPPSASEKVNCKPFSLQYSVDSSKKRHFFKDSGAPNIG